MKKRLWMIALCIALLFLISLGVLLLLMDGKQTPVLPSEAFPSASPSSADVPALNETEEPETPSSEDTSRFPADEIASKAKEEETAENASEAMPSEEQSGSLAQSEERTEDKTEVETEAETEAPIIYEPKITYTVSVFDSTEAPLSQSVTVKLMKNGLIVCEGTTDHGTVSFSLPSDDYEITFDLTDTPYAYDSENPIRFSKHSSSASVMLYNRPTAEKQSINAYSTKEDAFRDFEASSIGIGNTFVSASPNDRTYFLFKPETQGEYRVFLDTQNVLSLGYFGISDFVHKDSLVERNNTNSFALTVRESNVGNTYVIGITSFEDIDLNCILKIERLGDAAPTPEDLPFDHIEAENLPEKSFHERIVGTVTDLDITADQTVVLNESDGFYHLETKSGPLVYMRMTTPSPYLDPLATVATKTGLSRYFYDENGKLERKEQYNPLFLAYAEIADPKEGLVPLTEELAAAIKNAGEDMGWWAYGEMNYLFGITPVKKENAWLFACCTVSDP